MALAGKEAGFTGAGKKVSPAVNRWKKEIPETDRACRKNKKPLWREGAFERVDAIGKECVFESMAFQ